MTKPSKEKKKKTCSSDGSAQRFSSSSPEGEFSLDPRKHTSGPRKTSDFPFEIAVRLSCRPTGRGQRWFSGDFLFLYLGPKPEIRSSPAFGRRRWKRKSFVIAGKSSLFFGEDVTSDYKPSFLSLAPAKDHFSPKGRREMKKLGRGRDKTRYRSPSATIDY